LNDAIPALVREYCQVETVVAAGKPSGEILRVAAEQQSELIVIGVQGRGAVNMMFFGSTTNHVVREATCPVLTIRGVGHEAAAG
jgi:nucleotide-binding universal stress UspA family protein